MLNIKKMVLFLIVGVFLIGLSNVVFASVPGLGKIGYDANITAISRDAVSISGSTTGDFYVATTATLAGGLTETNKNMFDSDGDMIAYLRNTTAGVTNGWLINITIFNSNTSAGYSNITRINISLPVGLRFVNTVDGNFTEVTATNFSVFGSNRDLVWIIDDGSPLIINGTLTDKADIDSGIGNTTFTINVTSLPSVDGLVDFVITVSNESSGTYARLGGSSFQTTFNISSKIYLDGTIPTFANATTNSTETLNLTFSENMNATTIEVNSFNITFFNRSSVYVGVEVSFTDSDTISGNDTIVTFNISKIQANETLNVTLNMSEVTRITDLAGYQIASNTSEASSDGAPPTFKSGAIDLSVVGTFLVNLTLDFDEPMSAFGTTIPDILKLSPNSSVTPDLTFLDVQNPSAVTVGAINGTRIYITLNFSDQSNVTRWRSKGVNISINRFFNDTTGNKIAWVNSTGLTFTNDTTKPYLVNYTYSHMVNGTSQLVLGFSEAIDITNYTEISVRLGYDNVNHTASTLAIVANMSQSNGGDGLYVTLNTIVNSLTGSNFYKTLNLTINTTYTDIVAWWDRNSDNLYLSLDNHSIEDLANNPIDNNKADNVCDNLTTASVTWEGDTAVPTVLLATISDTNVTGPGIHRITIQFSENMTNSTQIEIKDGNTDLTEVINKTLHTIVEGTSVAHLYYNFTQDDTNEEWNISVDVTSAKDMSGNLITNGTTDLRFSYDSEPPYMIYAYLLNNGTIDGDGEPKDPYNGTFGGNNSAGIKSGDTLVLVFNEPLRVTSYWNMSEGNLTFRDGGSFCAGNCSMHISDNEVTLTTYGVSNLYLRGEWVDIINATEIQNITNRNLDKNSSSWFIRDKADNFATNKSATSATTTLQTGPKTVIADYAVEVTPNSAMTISFPTCVNTGNMSDYLPSATSARTFAYYYNTATWGEHAPTALVPLVGYRFTFNNASVSNLFTYSHSQWGAMGDNMLRVYLSNESECGPPGYTLTIGDAYNFLASNGVWTSNSKLGLIGKSKGDASTPDSWFKSLNSAGTSGAASDVVSLNHYDNGSIYTDDGLDGLDWDNQFYVYPYTGYWVNTQSGSTGSSTTYTFTGRSGRY